MISHSKPTIDQTDKEAVCRQLDSLYICEGEIARRFETEISRYLNVPLVRCFSSGRAALIQGLKTLDIGHGDEVIVPTYVCRSVYDAVCLTGATPVIVDVTGDYTLSPEAAMRSVTENTKAMIVVHLFGNRACLDSLKALCDQRDLVLIEDIAQSMGGEYDGCKLGSFGSLSFGSMQATKMFTTGEGGFLCINDKRLCDRCEGLEQDVGQRFSDIKAALGLSQLHRLDEFLKKRASLVQRYILGLEGCSGLYVPMIDSGRSVFFRFVVLVRKDFDFSELRAKMDKRGVQVRKGVDALLHHIEGEVLCPMADELFEQTVSLPLYPSLSEDEVDFICRQLKECI